MPQISVIIPTYNRAAFLQKAIVSVLNQSFADFELIIIDDGSTDETADIVTSFAAPQIKYTQQANKGASAARNAGIRQAVGDYIAFLDSDDCYAPDKLARQIIAMQAEPRFLVSHTDEIWYRRGKLLNQKKKHNRCHGMIFDRCLRLCAVGMSTVMARRELFSHFGYFDPDLPCCEDYDFWLRISVTEPFLLLAEPLTIKDGGRPDQLSVIHRIGIDKYRIMAIIKLIESATLTSEQRSLAIQELQKKCRIYGNGCRKYGRELEGQHYLKIGEKYSLPR